MVKYIINCFWQDLDQIIQVTVPGSDGEAEQVYNYSKLKELQSKLMLVGGQNEDSTKEVDYFVEVRSVDTVVFLTN